MPLPNSAKNKGRGDLIRSQDWNTVTTEVERLDTDKVNRSGDTITGSLDVGGPLQVDGGRWNLNSQEGDLRVGSNTHRLKIGVATGGSGAGDVRIRAMGGTSRLALGAGTRDVVKIFDSGRISVDWPNFDEPPVRMLIRGTDDVDLNGPSGDFIIGNPTGLHMAFDNNEIMVKGSGTTPVELNLQREGGSLYIGADTRISGQRTLSFQSATRQMLNLYSTTYGIGVQGSTLYFRSSNYFAWHWRGSHDNGALVAGTGGTRLMDLRSNQFNINVPVRINVTQDVNSSGTSGGLIIGSVGGTHLSLDGNEIMAKSNATTPSVLYLQRDGGTLENFATTTRMRGAVYFYNMIFGDERNVQWNSGTRRLGYDNSSRRYKENIRPLDAEFKNFLRLLPRTYTRPHDPQKWEIGYIAEEAESLGLKQLIYYDEEGRPDALNYEKMCIYLMEVVREHEELLRPKSPYLERYEEPVESTKPDKSSTKSDIMQWLDARDITYRKNDKKADLLKKVNQYETPSNT